MWTMEHLAKSFESFQALMSELHFVWVFLSIIFLIIFLKALYIRGYDKGYKEGQMNLLDEQHLSMLQNIETEIVNYLIMVFADVTNTNIKYRHRLLLKHGPIKGTNAEGYVFCVVDNESVGDLHDEDNVVSKIVVSVDDAVENIIIRATDCPDISTRSLKDNRILKMAGVQIDRIQCWEPPKTNTDILP